ncbi:putative homoserine O-acetyltransferase [Xylogone sp. PMI_703]|nr:putative homoserine O-acetyltransferase [Xylogone sp. PMI_703]
MSHKLPAQLYTTIDEFTTESGEKLVNATIAFTVKGKLNSIRTNAIVICHTLSRSAAVEDWWSPLLMRINPALDVNRFCIICCNSLGSPYGSESPLSYQFCNGQATGNYGLAFPKTTIRDDVHIHKHVMDILRIQSIYCVIGESMGGMLALEQSFFGKEYVQSLILIATAAKQSAWAIAWAENQRSTIWCGPKFREGHYGDDPPLTGLGAARMAALLTHRTHQSFEKRFDKRRVNEEALFPKASNGVSRSFLRDLDIAVVSAITEDGHTRPNKKARDYYLRYQGEKFNARFDVDCYLHILNKINSHDITRGRCSNPSYDEAIKEVLNQIQQPTLVIGISTDGLYPICEQVELFENIPNATLALVESDDGHDGFLLEGEQLNTILHSFFDQVLYYKLSDYVAMFGGYGSTTTQDCFGP